MLLAAVLLAVIAGGGYGIWLNRDAFGSLFGLGGGSQTAETTPLVTPEETPAADAPAEQAETPKLTQRLNTDGAETDPGPANGSATVGEGTSVATLTQPPGVNPPMSGLPEAPADTAAAEGQEAIPGATEDAAAAPAADTPADPALAVAQKAIFYEERTSASEGSAEPGTTVWSLVQESPGGDLPPEPAIRAEAVIPGRDIKVRMTIKRNADQSLPASHIIEMIFITPEGFPGGGVDNILRVAMKGSEQEAGNPLIGIPAKIADGFFLVALNDSKAETDANLTLLRRQSWIDIPVVYKSGRRALFTMEKGVPGDQGVRRSDESLDDRQRRGDDRARLSLTGFPVPRAASRVPATPLPWRRASARSLSSAAIVLAERRRVLARRRSDRRAGSPASRSTPTPPPSSAAGFRARISACRTVFSRRPSAAPLRLSLAGVRPVAWPTSRSASLVPPRCASMSE